MTKLHFLGTKGEIEESTDRHQHNSSLVLESEGTKLLLDYGKLRRYSLRQIRPSAVLITHAHPDHYAWLNEDIRTRKPVYLTRETLEYGKFRPANSRLVEPGQEFAVGAFNILAYRVIHSIRCPAVGYKLRVAGRTLVYNPDLVDIVEKDAVLSGVDYYIGDGSAIKANLVRRRGNRLFGHTRITTQINWCRARGIASIMFTHLGKETISGEESFTREHPEVVLAYDGLRMEIE